MSGSRTAPRILLVVAIVTLIVSLIGFIVTLLLNVFVLDKYNAYGEVPIPGSASLQLPEGEATISFHTQIIGSTGGGGLPIPDLSMGIDPPPGVPEPQVTEDIGATTTVNSDARIRVWKVQIPEDGSYSITTDGNVSAFLSPRLAFGHSSSTGWLPIAFGVLFAVSILDLLGALFWLRRVPQQTAPPVGLQHAPDFDDFGGFGTGTSPDRPSYSYEPTDDGIRIEALKTLAALRDSGALTESEFQSEKRRLLDQD